jgi:hypothetical protein
VRLTRGLAAAASALLVMAGTADARPSLTLKTGHALALGFASDSVLTFASPATQEVWLGKARSEAAQFVRVDVTWDSIAPSTRPAGFDPSDPGSPAYDWRWLDGVIRRDSAQGLNVLLMVYSAPVWAEGPNFPHNDLTVAPGSWKVDPGQLAAFATALARRYSGNYPDPDNPGRTLPHIRYWQAWNEPNLNTYLSPQWNVSGKHWSPASPARYRAMLDAFYAAVKHVDASNFVVSAGTAPYGDPPPHYRMEPVAFYRYLFCLTPQLHPRKCHAKVYADAFDSHPYELSAPPTRPAQFADNATTPDIWKIGRVVRAAVKTGELLPNGPKALWTTETGWDSRPPIKLYSGVTLAHQAQYIELGDYVLWKQGVRLVMSLKLRDPARAGTSGQHVFDGSGVFTSSGRPKPAATAFRFPFVVVRAGAGQRLVWTRVPVSGTLVISQRIGRQWRAIATASAHAGQVLYGSLRLSGRAVFRASIGGSMSLPWTSR